MTTIKPLNLRPLSRAQSGIWFAQMLDPHSPVYNIGQYLEIMGAIDPGLFETALRWLVAESDALHLRFVETDDGPRQYIGADPDWLMPIIDVSAEADPRAAAEAWMHDDLACVVDLTRGPFFGYALLRAATDCFFWYARCHHLCNDGFGFSLMAQQLARLYSALVEGTPPEPRNPGSWFDLLDEEENYRLSAAYVRDHQYWREQLVNRPEPATLSGKLPARSRGFIRCTDHLSRSVVDALRALGAAHDASLPAVVTAASALYLHRLTGASDLTLGMPVTARIGAGMRRTVGMVSNVLPLRLGINPRDGLGDLLEQVSGRMRQMLRHQRYRAEDLRHELCLHPEELGVYGMIVNIMPFNYDLRFAGFPSHVHNLSAGPVNELSIVFYDRQDGSEMRIDLDANPTNYTTEAVAGHQRRFLALLAQLAVATPDLALRQLEILGPGERQMLLESFNATARPLPEATLPELFEAQVARGPEATALVFGEESLTYQELNARANRLAHHLIGLGVGPESLVGVALERSIEMVVALLATLKAGGAYLPLDPDYPQARLAYMLADAAPALVITTTALSGRLPQDLKTISLDAPEIQTALDEAPVHNPREAELISALLPQHPAYVIYTSGSTGKPKGVGVQHQNVVRLFGATKHWFRFGPQDIWTLFHSCAFDFSVWELWGPLLHGGRLVLVSKVVTRSPADFLALLVEQRVTVLNQTPSAFYQLMQAEEENPRFRDGLFLRFVIFGGEALEFGRIDKWYRHHPDTAPVLVNMYGITETTVHVSYLALDRELARTAGGNLIGGNIPDLRIYVLDAGLEPMPIGVTGELYVAGAGLARGYLNRPGMTAERFVADPHALEPGMRMYRTGDLARWRADGTLEFLGRADQQVKIRGFRIELGEIEAALSAQPAIAQAAVIAREDGPGGKQLVAYVVADPGAVPDVATLRRELGQRLPDYMMPAAFVVLDALPLTANGKVDRRALPAPARHGEGYRAPRTPVEEVLCGLFAEILKLERVGIEDDFFALGGHSLLAMRLVSRVRNTLGVELAIRTVFEAPSVAELARRLRASVAVRPALVRQVRPDRLPLSYAQQRLWFLHRLEGASPTYNIPIALRLEGELDAVALETALADVVARHESLRTIFPEAAGVSFQQILPIEQASLALLTEAVTEAALASRLAEAASTCIELSREIPLRVWLLRLEPQRHVLLLLLHHIAGDGWSMGPLSRDLAQAYAARRCGEAPAFAGLAVQYADYSLWQRELLGEQSDCDSLLAQQLGFWRKALAGAPEFLNLPADHPRPPVISYRGATVPMRLDAGLHRRLRELAQASGASLFMVLHAGLATLLSRLGAGEDIPIGSPIAGRDEQALENLVGFFVNTLVFRTDVSGDPSFSGLLARVRRFDLEAYEHQEVPFEQVVEALEPARSLARHPLFQVMLVLQNAPEAELALPGLAVRPEVVMLQVAKFDLTIGLGERFGPGGQPLGIDGGFEYSVDLFERETVEAMAARFVRLLEAAVASPEVPLQRLEILGPGERQMLLESFNATARPLPEATLPELFEAQVARAPEATALVFGEKSLTYQELNARANRLAHNLIGLGVGPGALVGLFLDRSLEMVVGLLGVLKAGGAYVPLDPLYPQERLAFMIRDAGMAVLLTQAALAGRLPEHQAVVVRLDQDWEWIEAEKSTSSSIEQNCPEDLAYVNYTSGSTGKPKGVMIPHRAICNHMHWMQRVWPLTPGDVILQKTPFSFDASVWEFYAPLLAGGRLIMARPDGHADCAYLVRSVIEHNVSILQLVPSVLRLLLNEPDFDQCRSLKRVFCGGEALTLDLQDRFFERLPTASLHNLYGPTEATIDSTSWTCRREPGARTIPIGSPIDNTQVYILDSRLQPTPLGVPGELCIGGEGLARGYLNQPGLTAEKFIANPFASNSGKRLYRTGDRVRYLADGAIEFLGRMDHQVKVRGFRIELGEIESLLVQHSGVHDALAVVREDRPGDQKLVAYVVMRPDQKASAGELRAYLGARLPDYMVPSVFVFLEALPLLPNGKVDRGALPWPDPLRTELTDTSVVPHTPFEAVLVQIWAEVLGLERVGVHDNFFALGGHSLLATQIISRVRDAFQVELPLRTLFQAPTVGELALILVQQMIEAAPPESPDR